MDINKVALLIKDKTSEIRTFIDKAELIEVISLLDSSPEDISNAYRYLVNYNNKLSYYGKTLKFLIAELTEKRDLTDKATPSGANGVKQISGALNYLYALDKALEDISSGVFYSLKYYERQI